MTTGRSGEDRVAVVAVGGGIVGSRQTRRVRGEVERSGPYPGVRAR